MKNTLQNQKRNPLLWLLASSAFLLFSACGRSPDNPPPPKPQAETPRGWDIPTDLQEKAAYDYAHRLKLPDSVPKPVPFDFNAAEKKAREKNGKSVSEQYFEHLCQTEAGEYIFKMVENVEGVFQMRPKPKLANKPINFDRFALEAPIIMRIDDEDNIASLTSGNAKRSYKSGTYFVQPMYGKYLYLEQPKLGDQNKVIRLTRRVNDDPPDGYRNGYSTSVPGKYGWGFSLPFMVVIEEDAKQQARYGFTWRGIKREHDREFSIGSGEYLIVDMKTNEVLGVKRDFVLSGQDKNTSSHVWWGNAKLCKKGDWAPWQFVEKVLNPVSGINDQYIPDQYKQVLQEKQK